MQVTELTMAAAESFDRDFEQLFYRGDHRGLASVYADDAALLIEDGEPIEGRAAIEAFWQQACERGKSVGMKRTLHAQQVETDGNLGFRRGTVTLEIPASDGKALTHTVKYVTVWRRFTDGIWRLLVDISNRNAPLAAGGHAYGVELPPPHA